MAKRRSKIELDESKELFLKEGGEDCDYCVEEFFKDMVMRNLSFHTKRWYKEYTIMLILLDTGVRLSELINMKIRDVSIDGGKIFVGGGRKRRKRCYVSGDNQRTAKTVYKDKRRSSP